jgi:hypothetical protein
MSNYQHTSPDYWVNKAMDGSDPDAAKLKRILGIPDDATEQVDLPANLPPRSGETVRLFPGTW